MCGSRVCLQMASLAAPLLIPAARHLLRPLHFFFAGLPDFHLAPQIYSSWMQPESLTFLNMLLTKIYKHRERLVFQISLCPPTRFWVNTLLYVLYYLSTPPPHSLVYVFQRKLQMFVTFFSTFQHTSHCLEFNICLQLGSWLRGSQGEIF